MQVSKQTTSDVTDIGLAIYNDKLKAILEPDHNNEFVVIHVDTGDYAIGKTFA